LRGIKTKGAFRARYFDSTMQLSFRKMGGEKNKVKKIMWKKGGAACTENPSNKSPTGAGIIFLAQEGSKQKSGEG